MMLELVTVALVVLVCLLIRLLHLSTPGQSPTLYFKDPGSRFIQAVLKACPILTNVIAADILIYGTPLANRVDPDETAPVGAVSSGSTLFANSSNHVTMSYNPPHFWGKSGHLQTILHVKMGRVKPKWPNSERIHIKMPDGATSSYDIFSPETQEKTGNYILAVCPGIANSSECIYLRTFAAYANSHGYRMAILNHLGAIKSEKITSPRVFTYGGTEEYGAMVDRLRADYPDSTILAIGFSMGANIVTKYLGENADNQKKVLCGMSVCQGYEVNEAMPLFLEWAHLRRVYTFLMTLNQRRLLNRQRSFLFGEEARRKYGELQEKKVFSATSLSDIDSCDTCLRTGFANVYEYYKWCSSAYHMHNIKIPMLYMNSEDDPVVPHPLLKHPKAQAGKADNCIFMTTKHGGHLAYFEGGFFVPDNVTWLDRCLIQYADAITNIHQQNLLPAETGFLCNPVINDETTDSQEPASTKSNKSDLNENSTVDAVEGDASQGAYKRHLITDGKDKDSANAENKEKRNSLKRGTILQQATSYVQ